MKMLTWLLVGMLALTSAGSVALAAEESTSPEVVGMIQSVDDKACLLNIREAGEAEAPSKEMKFAINDKTSILKADGSVLTLQDLEVGNEVKITYKKPFLGFLGKKVALTIERQE